MLPNPQTRTVEVTTALKDIPAWVRIAGLTITMYTEAKKELIPARISVLFFDKYWSIYLSCKD
jgi:hypothetical protein